MGLVMGSSENLGTNSASFSNGGILPPSLLETATLGASLDDNSALTSLQISLRTPSGSDPINTELDRLEKSKNAAEDKNSNQGSTKYTPLSSNIFGSQQLYNQPQNFTNTPLLPTSSNSNSDKTKAKDSLTGNATDNSVVGITQQNLLNTAGVLGSVDNSQQNLSSSSVQTNSSAPPATNQTSTPNFAIRTEGTISINGNGDFDGVPTSLSDDALIYAAKGFIMNGSLTLPVQIDAAGNPIRDASGKLLLVDKAVAVASGYTTSIANGSSNKYAGLIPPPVVAQQTVIVPAYASLKQLELTQRIPEGTPTVTFNVSQNPINSSSDWSRKFPPPGTANNPTVVRVTGGGLNVPANLSLNNYIITVEQGDINFNGNGHNFNNVVLITNNGNVNLSNLLSRDLSVFASGSINMNGGARFAGSSLLATGSSNGNITFNGATSSINTINKLKVFSQGDITYNGASDTRGLFLSVKNFIFNGSSTLYGSISAKGNIIFNGQATVIGVAELMPDITPPVISATLTRDTAPKGQTNQDFITFDPTIAGTVTDTNPILEFRAGLNNTPSANYISVIAQRNSDGSFSFSRSQLETINGGTLSDGVYTLHLQAKDLYGNLSDTFNLTFTLDTTTPSPNNLDLRAIDDSGSSNTDNITNKNTPSITGNAEAGAVVQLFNNGQLLGQATANNTGVWQIVTSNLTDGTYNLTASATDIAGNVSNLSTSLCVTIDSALPLLTLNTPVDTAPLTPGARLTGSIDGTGSAVTALSYHFNNLAEITVPFNATGVFDQSLNLTGLANGAHTLTISATDTAGNIKTTQYHVTVIIDQEAPVISASLLHDTAPNGQTNSDRITFDPTITGTVIDASRVVDFKAGFDNTLAASFSNVTAFRNADGSFTFDRAALETIYGGTLPDGFHTLHLQAVDEWNNTSNIFDFSFTFDSRTSEPIFNLNAVSDSGVVGDLHTKFDTVTLTGLAEANSTVILEQTGAVTTSDNNGQFTFAHVSLASGDNSFIARSTDIAGNQNTYSVNIYRFSPPTAINLTGNTVAENSSTGTVIGQLSSIDPDTGDTHTYILENNADGRFRIVGNQLQVADGTLLNFESSTQHSVTVTSTDANGLSLTQVFAIALTNVNEAPSFTSTPISTSNSGSLYTYNIVAADPDAIESLRFTINNLPSWLTLVDNLNGTAILSGTPRDFLSNINSNIHLSVTDASGLTAIQDFTIAPSLYEIEENNFTVFRSLPLTIPATPSILSFQIHPQFDTTGVNSINDAIDVALVDANGNSLVHTVASSRDAFFNWTEGESTVFGAGASYDAATHTVSLNLTGINPGTNAQLVFRLVNNDGDITTSVRITDFAFTNAPDGTQAPVQTDFPQQISQTTAPNFNLLTDVSSSIGTEYHRTSFNADTHLLYADIALRNIGSYSIDSSLIVAVNHISDPTVLVRNPDGFTPDGLPYYDFSKLVGDRFFDPNKLTLERTFVFYNPQGVQFTYDLTVLAQLNAAPVILTQANKEIIAGHSYSYDVDATDPNSDSLTYKLLVAPDGMTIDQTTGLIAWNTDASNTGNQAVLVEVNDGRGGITQQKYSLSVIDAPPNRPPVFTSTPVVDAAINTNYTYQANASDADDDSLSFSLLSMPQGMTVDANTGVLSWTLTGLQLGTYDVTLAVADGKGGTAQQNFQVRTQAEPGNHSPIIVSNPITQFGITSTTSGAQTTTISTIVRDFRMWGTLAGHPDFETFLGNYPGMVSNTLADDRTPVFIAPNGYGATNASTFYQWYHDISNINQRVDIPITLTETAPGSGIWQYNNSRFFPIDNNGFSNQGYGHNYAFTLESHANFTYKGGEVFNFNGDDDVWVFINNKLAIDLGGVHSPQSASVNLDTLGLTRGQTYNLDLFFAERHTDGSSLQIQTSLDFGTKYVYKLKVADADNDSLKYELVQAPTGMSISTDGTLSWRPKLSQQGVYPITVKVTDARGGVAIQSFNLNVTPSNPGEIRGTVYRDANGDATKISSEAGLQGRIVYIDENSNSKRDSDEISSFTDANGNYVFTKLASGAYNIAIEPQTNWNLTGGTGAVILGDGQIFNNINIGIIEAKDPSLNQNPYFISTPLTTVVEAGKVFRYQAKAQDPDGDGLAYSILVGNQRGITVDSSTGVVAWQPTTPFVGSTIDVVLRAADPYGGVVLQPFQIQVVAPNTAPVFTNFPENQLEATVNYPIQYHFKAQDAEGDPITYSLDASAPSGATLNPITGVLSWKPTGVGNSTFNIIADDNKGGTASQSINIIVSANTINANPSIHSQPPKNIALSQTYLYTVQASDPNYDPLSYTLETAPQGMTIDTQGRITWQPGATQLGSNPVSIKISDGRGGVVTQAFNIDVVSTTYRANNAPTITSTPNLVTNLERTYSYNLSGSDPDNDLLLWSLDAAPSGMVIDAQRGTLRWQPSSNQIGEHNVKVRLTDAWGSFVGQEFTLTVTGTNIPSAIVSNPITRAAQNQLYTYTVVATDPENDPLTFSLGRKPAGMTIDSNGIIRWTPQASQIGSQQVEVFARDAQGAVTTQTYTIEVGATAINTAPSITSTPVYLAAVGSPYQYQVVATDPDAGDILTYQLLSVPASVTGITIDPSTGLLTWNNPVAGNYKIVVGAVDAAGLGAAQGFTLTARVNNAPVIRSTPVLTATPGSTYSYDVIASDADGDRLTYTLDQASRNLGMTLDTLGRLRWTPTAGNVGSHTVVITINDGNGGTQQQQYNLSVAADSVAPKVRLIANYDLVNLGESITFQARATDNIKVAGLQLLIDGTAVVLDSNGMATFKPTTAGTITAKAIAKDTAGNIGEATFSVAVIDTSDVNAPDVRLDLSAIAGGLITAPVDIKGSISDDGSLDYYRLLVAPVAGGEFKEIAFVDNPTAIADGVLGKFDPSLLQNDSYILRLEVADNGGHISYVDEVIDVAGDLKLGNFRLSFTDLTVPVTGIPITLTRTYDSLNSGSTDDFGYGWRMEFRDTDLRTSLRPPSEDSQLVGYQNPFKNGTKVYITLPSGKREAFTFKAKQVEQVDGGSLLYFSKYFYQPEFVADKGVTSTLTVESNFITKQQDADEFYGFQGNPYNPADPLFGGKYKLTTKEGVVYEIDAATGDLLTVTDTNGNKLTYTDADITSSTGQKITFGRDAQGRIATVTDPAGKKIRYDYNAQGDLISVTDREGNTTQMEYDQERKHYLDKIIDPLGRTGVKNEYGDDGRLKEIIDVNGKAVEMSYDPANLVQTIKDALGNSTTYEYDERGNIVTEIDALGGITRRTFDEDNNLLSEATPEGRTTRFTYDERGDKLSVTDPLGNTTKYTYNSLGQKVSTVDALGNVKTNTYDRQGNLLSFKSATGSVIKSNFDPSGRQVSLIGADGSVTEFNYDSSGNVINQIDASGNEIKYTYDANGKLLSEAKQVVVNGELETIITQWTYDLNGKVTSITDPVGNTTRYEYDHSGNLSSIIDSMNRKTRYIYDGKGQLIESINADGTSTKQNYDVLGRKVADIDELDRITRFTYDALGRLVETILPDNTPEDLADNPKQRTEYNHDGLITTEIDPRGNRTEYVYDLAGRVTLSRDALGNETTYTYNSRSVKLSETDALGRTTRFVFDEAGRQIKTIFADRTTISNTYNTVGLRDTATDQAGRTTHYEYNSLHRLVETILPDSTPDIITDNPRIRWEYDQLGRVTAQIDPSGLRTEYSYDEASRLVSIRDQRGEQTFTYDAVGNRISETDALGRTTQFIYNAMNHLVETRFPDGSKTRIIYDAVGNINAKTDELGRQTQFTYDAQNRLTGVIDALNQQTEYGYDLAGNLIRVQDANNNINSYEYDALNRRTTTILPLGQRSEMTYDAVGNLFTQKDFNGNTTRYEYNLLNRLVTKSFPDNTVVLYSYTPTGQVLTTTDTNGLTNYTYDTQDRLLSRTDPDGRTISYTYDIVGNRTSVTTPGSKTLYNYDQFHRLSQVIDLNGNSTQYTYDAVNNLTRTELPNGTFELKEYDLRNRLNFIEQHNSNGVIASYRYTLDLAGNRTQIVEQNGRESSYNYDLLNRLIQEAITDPVFGNLTNSFTYDPVGNRLTQNSSTQGLTTYSYDANDRLLSETHDGAATSYSYDNNGNTLSRSNLTEQVSYQWDFENHLLAATTTTANEIKQVQYRYNPDGVKVATTVDGVETRYLVDTNLSFAQVLEEYSIDGEVQTSYVFGHDLISQKRGETISYYHADALGSIRLITNTSGQVTDSYVYDAYGNILGSTGNTVNSYGYTGEQFDQNLGEYYLRARYYNPSTGRFTARDPFAGLLDEPLSLAKYPYVHGNPVNFTDPSGLFAEDGLTTIILQGILSAMPSISFTTALTLARVATPIFIGAALVATYALADAYLATDADEDDYNGLPIVFFTDGDLPMHRRHINFAQTGFGFTKSFYEAFRNGTTTPNPLPLPSVLNHLGRRREIPLDQAIKKDRSEIDNFLIARALGIRPDDINGRPYYNIPSSYARDEYPFATTNEGGPDNWNNNLVSVEAVTKAESDKQGTLLRLFYGDSRVRLVAGDPLLGKFGVLTSPVDNKNSGYIRRDGTKYLLP
jgi:fibro-slime domain-containing protein/RHS repeat-associated protein